MLNLSFFYDKQKHFNNLSLTIVTFAKFKGITLLAFGNGCPDIFSSWIAASDDRVELMIGQLLGGGIFCTSIVVGLILVRCEFKLARRPILRDVLFYAIAVFLTWIYCYLQQVTLIDAFGFIVIYLLYIIVAIVSQAIYKRANKLYELDTPNET